MQRLEVSGAVRLMYRSLSVKGLMVTVRLSSVKFHENLFAVVELLHANR